MFGERNKHGADFCPVCREMSAMKLRRLGLVGHFYYISFGAGDLIGYEEECSRCRYVLFRENQLPLTPSPNELPLPQLQAQTLPELSAELLSRLAIEDKLRRNPASLNDKERGQIIAEQLFLPAQKMEKELAETRLDWVCGIVLFSCLAAFITLISQTHKLTTDQLPIAFFSLFGLGGGAVIWAMATSRGRYVRRHVLPWYQPGLKLLNPDAAELQPFLAEAKRQGLKLGDVKAETIIASFRDLAGSAPSGTNPYRRR